MPISILSQLSLFKKQRFGDVLPQYKLCFSPLAHCPLNSKQAVCICVIYLCKEGHLEISVLRKCQVCPFGNGRREQDFLGLLEKFLRRCLPRLQILNWKFLGRIPRLCRLRSECFSSLYITGVRILCLWLLLSQFHGLWGSNGNMQSITLHIQTVLCEGRNFKRKLKTSCIDLLKLLAG